MSWRARAGLAAVLLTLSTAACGGEPPQKELQQARSAIAAARNAGAGEYAVDEIAAAEAALKNADTAVQQRDYRLALNHALDSRERAANAATLAASGRAAARANAEHELAAATAAQAAVAAALKAKQASLPAKALDTSRATLSDATARLQEARSAYAALDYPGAARTATQATTLFRRAHESLTATSAPVPRRRR